jgi:hypothetical protein
MNLRVLIALAIIAILATAAYGFAASNTIADGGHARDGTGTVSGYTVTNVAYTVATDPTILASVSFDLDASATTVKASLNNGGNWDDCAPGSTTNSWTCSIGSWSAPVKTVTKLRVVAVQ